MLAGQERQSSTCLLLPGLMGILSSELRVPWTDEVELRMLQTNRTEAIIRQTMKYASFLLISWVKTSWQRTMCKLIRGINASKVIC
jgi:Na+-driven multidrug efflux pump